MLIEFIKGLVFFSKIIKFACQYDPRAGRKSLFKIISPPTLLLSIREANYQTPAVVLDRKLLLNENAAIVRRFANNVLRVIQPYISAK